MLFVLDESLKDKEPNRCDVQMNILLNLVYTPMYMNFKAKRILYPAISSKYFTVPTGETIHVHCNSPFIYKDGERDFSDLPTSMQLVCISGNNFHKIDDQTSIDLTYLRCSKPIETKIEWVQTSLSFHLRYLVTVFGGAHGYRPRRLQLKCFPLRRFWNSNSGIIN